ncbi:MAG: hypothetical protein KF773_42040 [Deltaproteobacteria bacterium]|nr:hypothetical protein [Deltaproteobacteria bacterium]
MDACDLLPAELALDRLEAALAAELPAHVRAFARAHAAGTAPPPWPHDARALAAVARALGHEVLLDRAVALARLLYPIAVADDPSVAAAVRGGARTWPSYAALAAARDRAARARCGRGFGEVMRALHGVLARAPNDGDNDADARSRDGEARAGWMRPDGIVVTLADVAARWRGMGGELRLQLVGSTAHPRAFVVEPGREVILVVPERIATPAARFAALHELGHARVAALAPAGTPRVLDEAVASFTARAMEDPGDPWYSPHAAAARARRTAHAAALAAIEAGALPTSTGEVPWALVHDPGAQATYAAAEAVADGIADDDLARWLATERARIDHATRL